MNFTGQVHPMIIEQTAAHTRLRVIDAHAEIYAHGFAFADHDSVARAGANKLLGVHPRRQHAGAVASDKRLRLA
jgi:hypothetical protein